MAKTAAQLDREIEAFLAKPHKLGDPTWEKQWSALKREKYSKARVPTIFEIARALRYVTKEYTLRDGRIDGEQLAEGLAFGLYEGDADDKRAARELADKLSQADWLSLAERANYLAQEQGERARYLKQ